MIFLLSIVHVGLVFILLSISVISVPYAQAQSPTATTDAASGVGVTSATLNGTVKANNASTTVTFEYGTTISYGTMVTADQSPVTGASDTAVSKAITGLTSNTPYHYRVVGTNGHGTSYGADRTFTTALPSAPPTVTTDAASGVGVTSATLNGTVNANNASTTMTFEYGLTPAYGSTVTADQSPVTGASNTAVSNTITGLRSNTPYHYRVVGTNANGTANGADRTFTTSSPAPPTPPNPPVKPNTASTISQPIPDLWVIKGAAPVTFSLFQYFEDAEDVDPQLSYTVIYNRNPTIVKISSISPKNGNVTVEFLNYGVSKIGIRATDKEGKSVDTYFRVVVGFPAFWGGSLNDLCQQTGLPCAPGTLPENPEVSIHLQNQAPIPHNQ